MKKLKSEDPAIFIEVCILVTFYHRIVNLAVNPERGMSISLRPLSPYGIRQ